MALQEVCILGHTGNVGQELVSQIVRHDKHGHRNPTRIVGLVNSRAHILDPRGIDDPLRLTDRSTFSAEALPHGDLREVVTKVQELGLSGEVVFVDVTADGSKRMLEVHKMIRSSREKMVTANKSPLALFATEDFRRLTSEPGLYRYNASVMAGGDAIPYLQDAQCINDPVSGLEGCFSGTLGYITSHLEKGEKPFSRIVAEAYEQKYTEPHPWDDLNGLDVARKLLILARTAGFDVSLKDVDLRPLIPAEYGKIADVREFLRALEAEDDAFARRAEAARKEGKALRYVASLESNGEPRLSVGLREVEKTDLLGQLEGTANLVRIVTRDRAPASSPHIIIAKGAGIEKTAAAVRADMAKFLPNLRID